MTGGYFRFNAVLNHYHVVTNICGRALKCVKNNFATPGLSYLNTCA